MIYTLKILAPDGGEIDRWEIDTDTLFSEDWVRREAEANIASSVYHRHYGKSAEDANAALDAIGNINVTIDHFSANLAEATGTAWCAGENFRWEISEG